MKRLPPIDQSALDMAVASYRAAVEYAMSVDAKWDPRHDPFHRTRVARENAYYRAEALLKEASDVLQAAARVGRPHPRDPFNVEVFQRFKDRDFLRALRAVDAGREAAESANRRGRGTE